MVLPFLLAQAPVHDIALVPFTNVAIGLLWRSRHPGRGIRDSILAGSVLGLSMLTKGLEGIAIVGIGYAVYLLVTRTLTRARRAWRPRPCGGRCRRAAVVSGDERARAGLSPVHFHNRHVLGFTTETQRHGGQAWWYYLPVLVAGGFRGSCTCVNGCCRTRPGRCSGFG